MREAGLVINQCDRGRSEKTVFLSGKESKSWELASSGGLYIVDDALPPSAPEFGCLPRECRAAFSLVTLARGSTTGEKKGWKSPCLHSSLQAATSAWKAA